MAKVKAYIEKEHYKTLLTTTTNGLIADEPKDNGGEDMGFSPSELLAASLAACTNITLRMYADRKEFPLESVETDITFERDKEQNISKIKKEITLTGDLSAEQKQRLMQIADLCLVHKILTNPIHINSELK